MKKPTLFEFVRNHEYFENIKPVFSNKDFPFDSNDFEILSYTRQLCADDHERFKMLDGFYNDDELIRKQVGKSPWDYWESIIYQFETVVNHWVSVRLKPYINEDWNAPITGKITHVTVFDQHDVNIYVQRVRDKDTKHTREFFDLNLYDPIFEIAKIDWTRQEVHLLSTYKQLDMLENYKPLEDHPAFNKD